MKDSILLYWLVTLTWVCSYAPTAAAADTDKTLVAWVTLDHLTQRGGSVLTVQVGDQFQGKNPSMPYALPAGLAQRIVIEME